MSPTATAASIEQHPAPLLFDLFCSDSGRDWEWEGIRAGGKLHLYCYLRDGVVALKPFDFDV